MAHESPAPERTGEQIREEPELQDVLGWAEFCSWSALVMTPIIWWLQGPSVSTDQFVVRTALVVIAATGGITLRCLAWNRTRREASAARSNAAPVRVD